VLTRRSVQSPSSLPPPMCPNHVRITIAHTIRHRISSASLFKHLSIEPFDAYYNRRLLQWRGHVARMPLTRAPRKILTSWVDNPRHLGCPQMNWGQTLEKALQSNDLPTEFVKWREMAADRNQWRAICGSKTPSLQKRHRPPPDKTSGHNFETAMYHHEYKNFHGKPRWAGKMNREREKKYTQSDQPAWKHGGASATPKSRKIPVFDCAVALCTMQNALLVISNLTRLDLYRALILFEWFSLELYSPSQKCCDWSKFAVAPVVAAFTVLWHYTRSRVDREGLGQID
jgi:hypothetical protein